MLLDNYRIVLEAG